MKEIKYKVGQKVKYTDKVGFIAQDRGNNRYLLGFNDDFGWHPDALDENDKPYKRFKSYWYANALSLKPLKSPDISNKLPYLVFNTKARLTRWISEHI